MKKLIILIAALTFTSMGFAAGQIQVKGSDTEVNLVQMLAEKFMAKNKAIKISVTGGGSGTGIAALANRTADLANSSRSVKPEEEKMITEKAGAAPQAVIFATDALSVVVNGKNPVKQLTVDQIGKIFRGDVTNWKEMGGPDKPINLYGRQSNSGTFVFFRDYALKGDYAPSMKQMNGNAQIIEGVRQDETAVGYVGVGYAIDQKTHKPVAGIKLLKVSQDGKTYIDPLNEKDVLAGRYPIARPLYQYFVGKPNPDLIEFLKFELGKDGREMVKKEGFFDVTKTDRAQNDKVFKAIVHP